MTKKEDLGNNYYPSGWQPRYEFDEPLGKGEITHVGTDPNYKSKFDEILKQWGFDPKHYEIEGDVRASSWNSQLKGGEVVTFYAFKGLVRRKNPGRDRFVAKLEKELNKKPALKVKKRGGDTAFLFMMADWQLGKSDLGVENTVKRLELALTSGVDRIKALRKSGVKVNKVYLVGMGDLTENCFGFYDSQAFNIELSLAQQYHLARKLIMRCVDTFLPLVDEIVLAGVPGNHGEMSRSGKGKVTTDRLDNSDTMHLEICGEIMAKNPRYKKVKVDVATGFHQVLDIYGKKVAFTHGHMTGGGGDPTTKILNWWKGQMFGWLPSGQAEILISAHYHHFRSLQQGDRAWFQCPSIDKSLDFTQRTGMWNHPGVLTLTVNKDGWDNLSIL
jgi:hypothetical protein